MGGSVRQRTKVPRPPRDGDASRRDPWLAEDHACCGCDSRDQCDSSGVPGAPSAPRTVPSDREELRPRSTAGHVGPATQQHRRAAPPATQQHRRTAPPATQHGRARRAARGKASGPGARLARAGRTARLRDAAPKDDAGTHRSRVRAKAGREGAGVGSNERSAEICCCAEHIRPSARPSSGVRVIPRSTAGQAGTQAAGSSTSACSTSRAPPVIAGYLPARATLTSTAAQGSVMTRRSS